MKCVVVGSPGVGKTSLLRSCSGLGFTDHLPSIFDNFSVQLFERDNDANVVMGLWDTSCLPDYARLRPLSYPPTDIFALVFSLVDSPSLWDVHDLWLPEISWHCPSTPYILIGTKLDLRQNFALGHVSTAQGIAMALKIGATAYIECSALDDVNVMFAFECAALVVCGAYRANPKQKRCSVQ